MPVTKVEWDPTFLRARREAIVILVLLVATLVYTTAYCYRNGYDRETGSIQTYWGIPDWVFWGVVVPWFLCFLFTTWFCFWFMKDDPPGMPPGSQEGEGEAFPEDPSPHA